MKSFIRKFLINHFSEDVPLDDRVCYLMCIFGLLAGTTSVVFTISISLPVYCILLSLFTFILVLALSLIAFLIGKTNIISIFMTIIVGNIIFPLMFITEGGLNGGMAFYFLIPSICASFAIKKPFNLIIVLLSLLEYGFLIYFAYYHPQFIIPISNNIIAADMISGCLVSYLFIYCFGYQYSKQCERDRQKINKLSQMYCHQANTDELTDLFNRRYFKDILSKALDENKKNPKEEPDMFLVMFDIDNFKQINDTYGHPFGDTILKNFSDVLFESSSKNCISCRYGGEEFLLLIKNSNFDDAFEITENILNKTRNTITYGIEKKSVTVSAGFSACLKSLDYPTLIQIVDDKLYEAKRTGKNKIVV